MTPIPAEYDGTHLTPEDGPPVIDLGPHEVEPLDEIEIDLSARPSRKWIAATITGAGSLAVLAIQTGTGEAFQIAAVGFVVERAVSYLTPNT